MVVRTSFEATAMYDSDVMLIVVVVVVVLDGMGPKMFVQAPGGLRSRPR